MEQRVALNGAQLSSGGIAEAEMSTQMCFQCT